MGWTSNKYCFDFGQLDQIIYKWFFCLQGVVQNSKELRIVNISADYLIKNINIPDTLLQSCGKMYPKIILNIDSYSLNFQNKIRKP